ncbi:hypothetical protein KY284_033064 [Solanum tuberosum]|nr:hypothetical protein KY284_033064 [Solanum tuberosum]
MAHVAGPMMNMDIAAMISGHNSHPHKFKKNWNVQCDYCNMMGHTRANCYKLIGYPPDFKFRKKFGDSTATNLRGGDPRGGDHNPRNQAYNVQLEDGRTNSDPGQSKSACVHDSRDTSYKAKGVMSSDSNCEDGIPGRYSENWDKRRLTANYSHNQYNQMMQHMDNPSHYNRFQIILDRDIIGESSGNKLSDLANMGSKFFTSHMVDVPSASNVYTPKLNTFKDEWIVDTGASNHMISHKGMLHTENLSSGKVLEIGEENGGLYLLKHKDSTNTKEDPIRGLFARKNNIEILFWHKRMSHASVGAMQQLFNLTHDDCKRVLDSCNILPNGDKFTARSVAAVRMGYSDVSKGYVLYNLDTHSFFVSRDVAFNKDIFPFNTQPISHPMFLDNFTDTTDDVVPVNSPVNTGPSTVESIEHTTLLRDVRHSTRPKKLPS